MSLNPNELTHLKPKLNQNKKNEGRHMSSNRSFGCGPNSNGNFQLNDETLSPPRPPILSVIPATPQKQLLNHSFNPSPLILVLPQYGQYFYSGVRYIQPLGVPIFPVQSPSSLYHF